MRWSVAIACLTLSFALAAGAFGFLFHPFPRDPLIRQNLPKAAQANPKDFSFAVFADNRGARACLRRIFQQINSNPNVSFVLGLGDLTGSGKLEEYHYLYRRATKDLGVPLLTACGNHDIAEKSPAIYSNILGPRFYSFNVGENHFTVMDTASDGDLKRNQMQWLEKDFARAQGAKSRVVFLHTPLCDPRGGNNHHCMHQRSADKILRLFQKYHVTYIFASHIHGYFQGLWGGIPFTITGGGGAKFNGEGEEHFFRHFLLVRVKDAGLTTRVEKITVGPSGAFIDLADEIRIETEHAIRIFGLPLAALFALLGGGIIFCSRSKSRMRTAAAQGKDKSVDAGGI